MAAAMTGMAAARRRRFPSAARSSCSATTCARRCAWPPCRGARSSISFTHDSVGVGEDGPTHQPVEQLASLRAMPGLRVIRPADANETAAAWRVAVGGEGPTALVLTRQDVPVLDGTDRRRRSIAGRYVLADRGRRRRARPRAHRHRQRGGGVRRRRGAAGGRRRARAGRVDAVVGPVRAQPDAYQDAVLPPEVPTLAVEAGASFGLGPLRRRRRVGIDRFGASAPGAVVLEKLGFTPRQRGGAGRASSICTTCGRGLTRCTESGEQR